MSKIKVSELFYSIQGEGRYVGVPSIFLRTFGCNFTCGGFGMPPGQKSNERDLIQIDKYKTYKDLPLVKTGCDSYASWDPRFKHLSPLMEIDGIVKGIKDILPLNRWVDEHLVITGGEPLLGWQRAYPELLDHPDMAGLKEITFETNGTQSLTDVLADYLFTWEAMTLPGEQDWQYKKRQVTFSVSPKLSVSGEKHEDAIRPDIVADYARVGYTYLKFVIENRDQMPEVYNTIAEYRRAGLVDCPIYLMPVGGTTHSYYLNNRGVAELAMEAGFRYSPRLQVDLFKNAWGT